ANMSRRVRAPPKKSAPPAATGRALASPRRAIRRESLGMSLTDSLAPVLAIESHPRTTVTDPHARPESPGIRSSGWTDEHAHHLLATLDRDAFQASATRDFSHAGRKEPATGETTPKLYPVGSRHLQRAQYAVLTHPQRAAVLVIDLDHPTGVQGGQVTAIQPRATPSSTASRSLASAPPGWA